MSVSAGNSFMKILEMKRRASIADGWSSRIPCELGSAAQSKPVEFEVVSWFKVELVLQSDADVKSYK